MKPKTDEDILNYIEDYSVSIIAPQWDGGRWGARIGEGQIYQANSLRDVVLMVAYNNNAED